MLAAANRSKLCLQVRGFASSRVALCLSAIVSVCGCLCAHGGARVLRVRPARFRAQPPKATAKPKSAPAMVLGTPDELPCLKPESPVAP